MIPFNKPLLVGKEIENITEVIAASKFSGDGPFTRRCHALLEEMVSCKKALLTTSCTHALDMAALLSGIEKDDEVIMPSYTFTSTANAFVLRGAKIVFVDIRPDTMNIDESLIEQALTGRTRAICVMHYAGVPCEMDTISALARKYNVFIVEDAAQAILSRYHENLCGTLGDFGCFSFHETKNIHCGEGGALIINDEQYIERAEIVREKGTDRSKFYRGEIDKYSWVDQGSSYLPSEINAAFLLVQLGRAREIIRGRVQSWDLYKQLLDDLAVRECVELPAVPPGCEHNGHMFYIKVKDQDERDRLIAYLKSKEIIAVFHYVPLHSSIAGKKYGIFSGEDKNTTRESERLLRLPMYYDLKHSDIEYIVHNIYDFYK